MKKLIFFAILFLISNNVVLCQDAKKIASIALPSTVALIMEDNYRQPISLGSGFITSNGKIVTNLHVIRGASYGKVFINGSNTAHKIQGYFAIDEINDLAILAVPTVQGNALPLFKESLPEIGEKIYAIGNPKGLSGTISEGIISGIRTLDGKKLIQITAPISPGSSGGPVLNNSGQVIGVAVGTITDGQNLNFAISASTLNLLMQNCSQNISALNLTKKEIHTSDINYKTIDEGVTIKIGDYKPPHFLLDFSIKNNLPYFISDIRVLIIEYDESGNPTNYNDNIYCDSNADDKFQEPTPIRPFLAKKVNIKLSHSSNCPQIPLKGRLEIRVLDFKIHEEE